MNFVSSAKDNVDKGGLQGTVGSLSTLKTKNVCVKCYLVCNPSWCEVIVILRTLFFVICLPHQ